MYQNTEDHGFPATFAPLPYPNEAHSPPYSEYTPQYTVNRDFNVQPDAIDRWALPSLDVSYKGNGFNVVSSTSYFYRHTHDLEDSSYGTQQFFYYYNYGANAVPNQPYTWDGEHYHNQITEEARISFDPVHNLSGTAGVFLSHSNVRFFIPNTYAQGLSAATGWPNDLIWTQNNPATQDDRSIFGELYYKFFDRFNLTVGARRYWLKQTTRLHGRRLHQSGARRRAARRRIMSRVSTPRRVSPTRRPMPSCSTPPPRRAFAPAARRPTSPPARFPGCPSRTSSTSSPTRSGATRAASSGRCRRRDSSSRARAFTSTGITCSSRWRCPAASTCSSTAARPRSTAVRSSSPVISRPSSSCASASATRTPRSSIPARSPMPASRRARPIPDVPNWTATLGAVYTRALTAALDGFVSADYSYTGNSISLVNGGLTSDGHGLFASRAPYSLANLRFGVRHEKQELSLNFHNLGNAKPNLGDIGYVGYSQFEPGYQVPIPQVATLQPFTVMIQYKNNF